MSLEEVATLFGTNARDRRRARLRLDPQRVLWESFPASRFVQQQITRRVAVINLGRRGVAVPSPTDPHGFHAKPEQLAYLLGDLRRVQPARVLELGSGLSTVVLAEAVRRNGQGHVYSLEAEPRWLEQTQELLGDRLAPFVTLVHSRVEVVHDYAVPAWRYLDVPDGAWDYVHLDGPALKLPDRSAPVSCDLVDLVLNDRLGRGARGYIDGRFNTALLGRAVLKARVRFRYRPLLRTVTFTVVE